MTNETDVEELLNRLKTIEFCVAGIFVVAVIVGAMWVLMALGILKMPLL